MGEARGQARGHEASARRLVPVIVTLGGVAALSWEAIWQLRSTLALGVSALGTALTLATTMAGMTAGSLVLGQRMRRREPARPAALYGLLEFAIGIAGLALPFGFGALEALDTRLFAAAPALAPAVHLAGIALLLGIPTFAMGATIPVLAVLAKRCGVPLSLLYGLNTAGAAFGVLLFAFVLLPSFGLARTSGIAAALNFAACAAALYCGARRGDAPRNASMPAAEAMAAPGSTPTGRAGLAVFTTGFVTFALEVCWFRSMRAAFQSTTDSFAIMLSSVLLALALGARAVPWLRRRGVPLPMLLGGAGVAILLATPIVERIDLLAGQGGSYASMLGVWYLLSLGTIGPATLLLGTVLPWQLDARSEPARVGRLYAINTLGAVLGSLLAAWLLLPTLGFARSCWTLGIGTVLVALALSPRRAPLAIAAATSLALAMGTTASLGRDRVQGMSDLPVKRILAHAESPDSTVSVIEGEDGARRLVIDGFIATSERPGAAAYMKWMGRLPMLLHPDPKRVLVIAFGTGQTANGVREPGLERLDVAEISPSVLSMAPLFESNDGVLDDARVRTRVMDGRAWVRRSKARYDVVTLEPMPPFFAGMNALYSKEFYELAASRLAPGGIAVQWLPVHLVPQLHCASLVATFAHVFPDSILWVHPGGGTGILLGRQEANGAPLGSEWPGFERLPDPGYGLDERAVRDAVALGPDGMAAYASRGHLITDDNQLLAYGGVLRQMWARPPVRLGRSNLGVIRRVAMAQDRRSARR